MKESNIDAELRVRALESAISSTREAPKEEIVARAEAYYTFLKGKNDGS